jgi:hypothetical protein
VPLEALEGGGEHAEQRIVRAFGQDSDRVPPDLRGARAAHRPAPRLCKQLRTEAGAEQRRPAIDQLGQQCQLALDPGVRLALVGVHRAAEGQHGVVAERVGGRLELLCDQPLVVLHPAGGHRLGEDAWAGVGLMHDRERPHGGQSAKPTYGDEIRGRYPEAEIPAQSRSMISSTPSAIST